MQAGLVRTAFRAIHRTIAGVADTGFRGDAEESAQQHRHRPFLIGVEAAIAGIEQLHADSLALGITGWQRQHALGEPALVTAELLEQALGLWAVRGEPQQWIDDRAARCVSRFFSDVADAGAAFVQNRQAEERCAGPVIGDFRVAGIGAVEIVDAKAAEQREQRGFVAAINAKRVVRRGVRAVALELEVLEIMGVAQPGEVGIQGPCGVVPCRLGCQAVFELYLVAVFIHEATRHPGAGFLWAEVVEIIQR